MGYTTEFEGYFDIDKQLDKETAKMMIGLAETRRMVRSVGKGYGIEGEFFIEDETTNVVDYNTPPSTQPGLWCQWEYDEKTNRLRWDGNEKFYNYTKWLVYLIDNVLAPNGYVVDGIVRWDGEDCDDCGTINVRNNIVKCNGDERGNYGTINR